MHRRIQNRAVDARSRFLALAGVGLRNGLRCQHRYHQEGNDEGRKKRERHGKGLLFEEFCCHPVHVDDREKNDHGRECRCEDRGSHLGDAVACRRFGSLAFLDVAENTLDDDDGIVDSVWKEVEVEGCKEEDHREKR